jgi:hypothetical protein
MRKNNVFEVELRIYQQSMKKEKYYFPNSYDSIYYKESLMLLANCVVAFDLLILQGFHIKQEELICQKLILILQGIKLLFSKDSSTIIFLWYSSLSYVEKSEK